MANQLVTSLDPITTLPDSGIIHVVDTTDNTQNVAGSSFKITKADLLKENTAAILLNTDKVGITPAQATAITNNTVKVGITTSQASDIQTNNSKIGISTGQASAIVLNTAKVSFDSTSSTRLANTSGTNTGDQDLSGKQNNLVSGTNIKTINGAALLGSGDLVVSATNTVNLTGNQTIADLKTFSSEVSFNTNLKSTSNNAIISDSAGVIFRGVRTIAWPDSVDTRFFQVGIANDRVLFTAQNGSPLTRLAFTTSFFQVIGQSFSSAILPIGVFEVDINTGRAFVVMPNGNVLINSSNDNGVDKMQVNGSAIVTTLKTSAFTVATLPAPPAQGLGAIAHVTDALNPTYLGTLTGGGTVKCPVFYNGTAWVSS